MKKFLILLLLPIIVYAQFNNWYVVGSVGRSYTNLIRGIENVLDPDTINSIKIRNVYSGFSYGAKLGYKINRNVSLEINYFDLAGLKKDNYQTSSYSRQSHDFFAGLLKYAPPFDYYGFHPYVALGVSHRKIVEEAYNSRNELVDRGVLQKTQPVYSVGFDYLINKNWFVNASFIIHRSFVNNKGVLAPISRLFSVGAGFAF